MRGILWIVLAMAGFAIGDAFVKVASFSLPVGQIILAMGVGGTAVFSAMALVSGLPLWSRAMLHPAILFRGVVEIIATLGVVPALALIPLSTTVAILQTTPLLVVLGAILFFNESVGWRRWTAIGTGFAGVLLILRPGLDVFDPNTLFAVLGAVALAARDLSTRGVPRDVPSVQLALWGFTMIIPAGVLVLAVTATPVPWSVPSALVMVAAILATVVGYFSVTVAMRVGEISIVTPFRYSRLIFGLLIGVVFFAERPDLATLTGSALIIASGLYTLARDRAVKAVS